jgi:hypothetical protein
MVFLCGNDSRVPSLASTAFFQHLSNSLLITHATIRCYIFGAINSVMKQSKKEQYVGVLYRKPTRVFKTFLF